VATPGGAPQASAFEPSHLAWHAPLPAHFGRAPRGSPATGAHVPRLPGTSHAWHCPAQVELQQTPSTQRPLPQEEAVAPVHVPPLGSLHVPREPGVALQDQPVGQLALEQHTPSTHVSPDEQSELTVQPTPAVPALMHTPLLHLYPAAQSGLLLHVVRHAVAPHAYGVQSFVAGEGVGQVPTASQTEGLVCTPPAQAAAMHVGRGSVSEHAVALAPLQAYPHGSPKGAHDARMVPKPVTA
jgi:hypothetical protein